MTQDRFNLVSGVVFLDQSPASLASGEYDWAPTLPKTLKFQLPAARPRKRPRAKPKRVTRTRAKRATNAHPKRSTHTHLNAERAESKRAARTDPEPTTRAQAFFGDLPSRLSSRFAEGWVHALSAAGVLICPACRARNRNATFCRECGVDLHDRSRPSNTRTFHQLSKTRKPTPRTRKRAPSPTTNRPDPHAATVFFLAFALLLTMLSI